MNKEPEEKSAASAGCVAIFVFVAIAAIGHLLGTKIESSLLPQSHSAQIEKLDEMQGNLNDLFYFFEGQKNLLVEQQNTIAKLEAKSEQLKPIVDADQDVVKAVLAAHEETVSRNIWWERGVSFCIGVLSSLAASAIFLWIRRDQ